MTEYLPQNFSSRINCELSQLQTFTERFLTRLTIFVGSRCKGFNIEQNLLPVAIFHRQCIGARGLNGKNIFQNEKDNHGIIGVHSLPLKF